MNDTNFTTRTIQDLNDEQISKLLAPTVFLVVSMIIGVPGNLTVLIIYGQKYIKSVYRSIILNLAVIDLVFCTIVIPFNIYRVGHYYTFPSRWVCRTFVTFIRFGIMYSTHLLMLLSLHRFRKICMPLKSQVTVRYVSYWVGACFVVAIILSSPKAAIETFEHVNLGHNLTGHVCQVAASNPSVYVIVYNYGCFILFLCYTLILFLIYLLIGRKVYQQRRWGDNEDSAQHTLCSKMTKIAFIISVVFAASYFPLFIVKVTNRQKNEDNLSDIQFSVLRIMERFYIVNHVVNPFVYAIFDNRFRQYLKTLVTFRWRSKEAQIQEETSTSRHTSVAR